MKVEFHPADDPDTIVATASWTGRDAVVEAADPKVATRIGNAFRRTPVLVRTASTRSPGTQSEVLLQPGDLRWFLAAAQVRVPTETGLRARVVPETVRSGYDPAAGYRTFAESVDWLLSSAGP